MSEIYQPFVQNSPIAWKWIVLAGKDAASFLQRLSTARVVPLAPDEGALGCFLSPPGHIEGFFQLWRLSEEEFAFEFDAGSQKELWQTKLLNYIDSHTFREELKVSDPASNNECWWLFPDPQALGSIRALGLQENRTTMVEDIRLCDHGTRRFGKTWITAWGRPVSLSQWLDRNLTEYRKLTFPELDGWRIERLQPAVDSEINEKVLPLEIGLRDAIADQKGCYPGQEVIEKIISRGAPPRRLVKMEGSIGSCIPQPGFVVEDLETHFEVGKVTSLLVQADRWIVLALLRKTHAEIDKILSLKEGPHATGEAQGRITQIAPYA